MLSGALLRGAEEPAAKTSGDVMEWIAGKDGVDTKPFEQRLLRPEWIGTVKPTAFHDKDGIYHDDKPDDMRLNKIGRDDKGRVEIARAREHSGTGLPAIYLKDLPSLEQMGKATTVAELRQWFGPQHGWTDGWGGEEEMHWTEGWTYFSTTDDGKLRWLSVFAHVVGNPKGKADDIKIEILHVNEGLFQKADPKSEAEKLKYKTAEELEAVAEAARASERGKLPRPLRDLVAADEKQDDSDLAALTDVMDAIRLNPQPELFNQLAERIDEGTCSLPMLLEGILGETLYFKLKPWTPEKKQTALRQATAAFDHVATSAGLEKWTEQMLIALGGGHIKAAGVDIEVEVGKDHSRSMTDRGSLVGEEDLPAARTAVRAAFEAKFPTLRPQ